MSEALHVDAHAAGAAGDGAHGGLQIRGRKVRLLGLGDLLELLTRVILPTLAVLGVPLPFSMPIALRISTEAGGVFMMKVKLRSEYTVITVGIGSPFSSF